MRRGLAFALFLLSFFVVKAASAARAALYVEGPHSVEVTRDVGAALSPRAKASRSQALDASLRGVLDGAALSEALSTRAGARMVAAAARTSLKRSGADFAVIIALPAERADRHAMVLFVPGPDAGPALLLSAELPSSGSPKERAAAWENIFQSPATTTTRLDESEDDDDSSAAPVPAVAAAASKPDADLESPYAGAITEHKGQRPTTPSHEHADATPPATARVSTPNRQKKEAVDRSREEVRVEPEDRSRPQRYFLRAAFETSFRHFSDTEASLGAPRTYDAFPIIGAAVAAEVYPLFGVLGAEAAFAHSLGLRSTTSERKSVDASWTRIDGALRGRVPFGKGDRASFIAALAGWRYSSFVFDSAPTDREVPTAKYQLLRFGLDARIAARKWLFFAGADYDHIIAIAALGTTKARAPGNGMTAHLGLGYRLLPWLTARLDARFEWLRYDLDRKVPAHAVDEYGTLDAGFGAEF